MIVKHIINNKVVWGYRYSYKQDGKWKVKSVRSSKWTKRQAELEEDKFKASLQKPSGDTMTFSDLYDMYFEFKKDKLKIRAYRDTKTSCDFHILPFFADKTLSDIKSHDIEKWQKDLLKATYEKNGIKHIYSNRQLEKVQINFKAILGFAYDRELIDRNPFNSIGMVKRREVPKEDEKRFITVAEFNRLIQAINTEQDELTRLQDLVTFSILFWCGLRKGELMALDIKDYNILTRELNVYKSYDYSNQIITSTKTQNSNRVVVVPDIVDEYIVRLISLYRRMYDFSTDKSLISYHVRMGSSSLDRKKDKYCTIAGLNIKLHDLGQTR